MKKQILSFSISLLIVGAMLTNCQSNNAKKNNSVDMPMSKTMKADITPNNALQIQEDTVTAYQKFVKVSEEKFNNFEKNIAELKIKIAQAKKEDKIIYEKNLAILEKKNNALKAQLKAYKDNGIDDWNKFSTEFNNDLDDLGIAIKNFTDNSNK